MGCGHGKSSAPTAKNGSQKTLLAPAAAETEPLKKKPESATAQTSEAPLDTAPQSLVSFGENQKEQFYVSPTQYDEGHAPPAQPAKEQDNSTTSNVAESHTETHVSVAQSAMGNVEVADSNAQIAMENIAQSTGFSEQSSSASAAPRSSPLKSSNPQQGSSQSNLNEAQAAKSLVSPNAGLTASPPQQRPNQTQLPEAQPAKAAPPIQRREKFCCC